MVRPIVPGAFSMAQKAHFGESIGHRGISTPTVDRDVPSGHQKVMASRRNRGVSEADAILIAGRGALVLRVAGGWLGSAGG
jgi:hypothetical protein